MDAQILRLDQFHRGIQAAAQVTLEITRGRARQRMRAVSGRIFLIGTSSDCDLVLGDLSFPEVYAYLFVDGPKVTIRRLGSGPPLFVCGERIDRGELFQSDAVEFGPFELRIAIHAADAEEPHKNCRLDDEIDDDFATLKQDVAPQGESANEPAVLQIFRHSLESPTA